MSFLLSTLTATLPSFSRRRRQQSVPCSRRLKRSAAPEQVVVVVSVVQLQSRVNPLNSRDPREAECLVAVDLPTTIPHALLHREWSRATLGLYARDSFTCFCVCKNQSSLSTIRGLTLTLLAYSPPPFFVGASSGACAAAGVPGRVHCTRWPDLCVCGRVTIPETTLLA